VKKLISLLLLVCILAGGLAGAEEPDEPPMLPANGYTFDFELKMHPEAFQDGTNERILGYSELMDALRFQGTFYWTDDWNIFDLELSVIPKTKPEAALDFRIHGAEDLMYLNSSLFGDKTVALGNSSMLDFCNKMSEHLGIPLNYLGLLYPYNWKYALSLPVSDWEGMMRTADERGVIAYKNVDQLWSGWRYRVEYDGPLNILADALCRDSEGSEAFQGVFDEFPDFFRDELAGNGEITVRSSEGEIRFSSDRGEFFVSKDDGQNSLMELTAPRMKTGFQPVFFLEKTRENGFFNSRITAQLLGNDRLMDLVNLQASLIAFPEKWPVDCFSLLSLNLTGNLLPNVGTAVFLSGQENGHFRAEVRKPTVDMEPGAIMVSVEGNLNPMEGEVLVRGFTLHDLEGALAIFSANDKDINAFIPELVEPVIDGMLHFLVGIPTRACQTMMDDLSEMGVFSVLLRQ